MQEMHYLFVALVILGRSLVTFVHQRQERVQAEVTTLVYMPRSRKEEEGFGRKVT